ncbi:MAG: ABC transporter ATP-binding protein [Pirellulales bacterium]|nr:ABC transporter ATP-binding protein [Pirellulales bacterium]
MERGVNAPAPAVEIDGVSHRYGERLALDRVSLRIAAGELFTLVGPNGGGKSTLFRLAATLIAPQSGTIRIQGFDVRSAALEVRRQIGVVFQSPSLDRHLTVDENLRHQGRLYGLRGYTLADRCDELLARLALADRRHELTGKLSGGLRRRVELAKGLLHRPTVLLLDEPSTGLDPAARGELWQYLSGLRRDEGVTVVATTHLLEEAERADRVAILDSGRLVALDAPGRLRAELGGDYLSIEADQPERLATALRERFGWHVQTVDHRLRIQVSDAQSAMTQILAEYRGQLRSLTLARPTLEDVFIARTGRRFEADREEAA